MVLTAQALPPLLRLLNDHTSKVLMLRTASWALVNICRGKTSPPDFAVVSQSVWTLGRLINHSTDEEVLVEACWALSCLPDGTNDKIQQVIEAGVTQRLVELTQHTSTKIITPALRAIGNIITGGSGE